MRLFSYYALHSIKNQLKKLFKTWVLIFIIACFVIGGLIGLGVAVLSDMAESSEPETVEEQADEPEKPPLIEKTPLIELIAGGVILALFAFEAISADKNGSRIFLPADVNLLFSSPMKPQSVLMFRLMTQLGLALVASIYMVFQLPNLTLNLGLGIWAAISVIAAWGLSLIVGKLIQVLLYTVSSTHSGIKNNLRKVVYLILVLIAAGFFAFWKRSGAAPLEAAQRFFNAPATRYIPLWGWIKGFMMFAIEGKTSASLLCLAAVVVSVVALILVIWNVKADFYEDAMAKSEETAELLEQARSEKSGGVAMKRRRKDRSEKLHRDGLHRGAGANVFFFKSMYNRFRFAHLGFLTKTTETYILAAAAVSILCRYVIKIDGLMPVALVLSAFAFFRSLGNPLEQDTKMDFFLLIPESTGKKLFYSLMGGTVNCLLDILPALILAVILLGANPLLALAWIPFIISIDFYATTVGAFINLSVPVAAGKTIKQFVQILFIYFGLIPDAVIMAVAIIRHHAALGALGAALLNVALGFLFFSLCPRFIDPKSEADRINERSLGLSEPERRVRIARRNYSRLGFGVFLYQGVYMLITVVVASVLTVTRPEWTESVLFWIVNFAPQYLIALPLAMLVIRRAPRTQIEKQSLRPSVLIKAVLIGIFFMMAGSLIGQLITGIFNAVFDREALNPVDALIMNKSLPMKILFAVIIGPIVEEFVFRKQMIDRMRAYGEKLAVICSAVIFALFHGNFSQAVYAFLLGLVFGYVYLRSGKLRYTCVMHMFFNFVGGIVSPFVLEKTAEAVDIPLSAITSPGTLSLESITSVFTPGFLLLMLYETLLIGGSVAGIVMLCISVKRLRFAQAQLELPKGKRFSASWLNPGMILFAVISVALFAFTLLNG